MPHPDTVVSYFVNLLELISKIGALIASNSTMLRTLLSRRNLHRVEPWLSKKAASAEQRFIHLAGKQAKGVSNLPAGHLKPSRSCHPDEAEAQRRIPLTAVEPASQLCTLHTGALPAVRLTRAWVDPASCKGARLGIGGAAGKSTPGDQSPG